MNEYWLRWFDNIQCWPVDSSVRKRMLYQEEDVRKRRGEAKNYLGESCKKRLEGAKILCHSSLSFVSMRDLTLRLLK